VACRIISFGCLEVSGKDNIETAYKIIFFSAPKVLDSNGHFPSGTMSGTLSSLGDFEQCLSIKDPDGEEDDPHAIVGKYCLLKMRPALPPKPDRLEFDTLLVNLTNTPMEGSWIEKALVPQLYNFYYYHLVNGICVPSSCNEQDLEQVMGGCKFAIIGTSTFHLLNCFISSFEAIPYEC